MIAYFSCYRTSAVAEEKFCRGIPVYPEAVQITNGLVGLVLWEITCDQGSRQALSSNERKRKNLTTETRKAPEVYTRVKL